MRSFSLYITVSSSEIQIKILAEIHIRITSAMAVKVRLNRIRQSNTNSFDSKLKLYKSFVVSILLYGWETWTLLANRKRCRLSRPSAWGTLSTSSAWRYRPATGCEARSASLWAHRNLFLQLARETNLMLFACHMPQQFLQNHYSGHFGGWATPWLAFRRKDWKRIFAESYLMFHDWPDLIWSDPQMSCTTASLLRSFAVLGHQYL